MSGRPPMAISPGRPRSVAAGLIVVRRTRSDSRLILLVLVRLLLGHVSRPEFTLRLLLSRLILSDLRAARLTLLHVSSAAIRRPNLSTAAVASTAAGGTAFATAAAIASATTTATVAPATAAATASTTTAAATVATASATAARIATTAARIMAIRRIVVPFAPINFTAATTARAASAQYAQEMSAASAEAAMLGPALNRATRRAPFAARTTSRTATAAGLAATVASARLLAARLAATSAAARRFTAAVAATIAAPAASTTAAAIRLAAANRHMAFAAAVINLPTVVVATSTARFTATVAATSRLTTTATPTGRFTAAIATACRLAAIVAARMAIAVMTAAAIKPQELANARVRRSRQQSRRAENRDGCDQNSHLPYPPAAQRAGTRGRTTDDPRKVPPDAARQTCSALIRGRTVLVSSSARLPRNKKNRYNRPRLPTNLAASIDVTPPKLERYAP